ncbi:MAG TPA: carbonic anhydrase [Fibrobacteria bacterium]|nr:carbonic anhydrase [Fibrobacteria bacterium]
MCDSCPSPERRQFLRQVAVLAAAMTVPGAALASGGGVSGAAGKPTGAKSGSHAPPTQKVTPDEALARLLQGNKRYVANKAFHPNASPEMRAKLANGQAPFAAILGCADSRVPPEIVFDHGLGDIFVVRVAGNVVEDEGAGSLEYAIEHLGTPLIVVLGHERCGAIKAAIETLEAGAEAPGHVASLVAKLKPAVEKTNGLPGDKAENAMRENAKMMATQIASMEPILKEKVEQGKVKVVAMRYDLDTGAVEVL